MKRVLFLYCGSYFNPEAVQNKARFELLSRQLCGEIVAVVDLPRFKHSRIGNFELRGQYLPGTIRNETFIRDLAFVSASLVRVVYRHYFHHKYDVIVAPEPLVTGILALAISRMTGVPVVVKVGGIFEEAFKHDSGTPSLRDRLKERYARAVLPFVLSRAEAVRLLFRAQVDAFPGIRPLRRVFVFASHVAVNEFYEGADQRYLLFIGYPWHLKGVDLLISAFNLVCDEFPTYSLKVVGYCPDRAPFLALARGNGRVEFCDPVRYPEVVKLMAGCSLFVLPSRTEAMGRVLLEAMAARKPIIASRVGGIPTIVRHEDNGLLFEPENVEDLARQIRRMLSNPTLAARLADSGNRRVKTELSEEQYFKNFTDMIDVVMRA